MNEFNNTIATKASEKVYWVVTFFKWNIQSLAKDQKK